MAGEKLRVGLLVDSERASKYVYDLARWGQEHPDLEVSHLIVHGPEAPETSPLGKAARMLRTRGAILALERVAFALLSRFETALILGRSAIHRDHFASFPLDDVVPAQVRIVPLVSKSGFVHRFSDEDVARVANLGLDVLVRCGSGILRGGILEAARLGVVSFHHGDNRINRGGPAAFWETYYRWPKTGFVIQRLTEELDGGAVLLRGGYMTRYCFSLNQADLYTKSNVHMKGLLKRVATTRSLPDPEPFFPYSAPLYRLPRLHQTLAYALKLGARLAGRAANRILRRRDRWGVSFSHGNWRKSVLWRSREVAVPAGRFWADPFLVERAGRTYCFVEDFAYEAARGHITALEITSDGVAELGSALVEPFHLSFPFLFEFDGELYMCPETFQAHQVRIYRCVDFPLRWELASIALDDVSAVDSMLFPHGGKWWMLSNIDSSGIGDHDSELHLFSAESPLATNWTPHPRNPLVIDSERARNGGLLVEGGMLYRVAQRQGFEQYGVGMSVWQIAELTPTSYRERFAGEISPAFHKGLLGAHHLSATGKVTAVDHLRRSFVP
jgi:hypothetical protein